MPEFLRQDLRTSWDQDAVQVDGGQPGLQAPAVGPQGLVGTSDA